MEPEQEKKLEKLIKKLENIDIREWNYSLEGGSPLITEIFGLRFKLEYGYLGIKNIREGPYYIDYFTSKIKDEPLKKMLISLYRTIYAKLKEHQKKELEEKLDSFLTE